MSQAPARTEARKGTPRGNVRHGLTSGSLPKGGAWIVRLTNTLRQQLERATLEAKGKLDLGDVATIQSAVRWERHALLSQRWLRIDAERMTADQRLSYSREVARASAERDRCIERLKLGAAMDPWQEFIDGTRPDVLAYVPAAPSQPAGQQCDDVGSGQGRKSDPGEDQP